MANSDEEVVTLATLPGIKRDGTLLEGNFCSDGEWVRFQRGLPKKIGGYRRITDALTGPVRKFLLWSRKDLNYGYSFSGSKIETIQLDSNLVGNNILDRTPSSDFTAAANNMWTADTQYDDAVGSKQTIVIAHCNQSLANIDDDTATKPFWALAASASSLFQTIPDAPAVSGGVFSLAPYTIAYGSDGFVGWSDINQPQVWATSTVPGDAGSDRVTGSKVVAGMPLRSGVNAGLLWSLDSVIRMDYVAGAAIWRFSTISAQSSIMAQNSVIEYDGLYYWIGIDRFLYFDSSVHELPNSMNQNYFFDNLNYTHRQKIWATKVPKFGEIWWFYPRGDATECSHAIIFNVNLKTWYDIELPRSAGFYSQVRHYPTWTNSDMEPSTNYGLYQHEFGQDAVVGDNQLAICSSYTTQNLGYPTGGVQLGDSQAGSNRCTRLTRVEPDFLQVGDMTCTILGQSYAQSPPDPEVTFDFTPTTPYFDPREQRRHLLLKFASNTLGGFFEGGRVIIHTEPGDNRP